LEVKTTNSKTFLTKSRDRKGSPLKRAHPRKLHPKKPLPRTNLPLSQRVNRILSLAGITSRRRADEWIRAGRVTVNGEVLREPGAKAVWGKDDIRVDGKPVPDLSARLYLMLNKPFGYVSSLRDPEGRPVVTELLAGIKERVYPVGRLDFDSLGLLLLTNDGEWAHRLTHPRFHVSKTYKVTVSGDVSEATLQRLRSGVYLEEGFSGPAKANLIGRHGDLSDLRITVTSGKKRLVRRMIETVGCRVVHLIRTGFGILELGDLKIGRFRSLEPDEVEAMKKLAGLA
jgi:23S rRNA pseudouridine2605 synthase